VRTQDHNHIVTLIDEFKDDVHRILKGEDSRQRESLISDLKEAYDDLVHTQVGLPPFEEIIEKIKFYLGGANVKLINATSSDEIKLTSTYNLFVGGNKLGRGVTLKTC